MIYLYLASIYPSLSHLEVDVGRVLGEHPHHVGEALVDSDVERRAHGVVQEVDVGPFAQQQPRDLRLVTEKHIDTDYYCSLGDWSMTV